MHQLQRIETDAIPTVPGTPFAGGFYVGRSRVLNQVFAIILAPKAEGEHENTQWNDTYATVDGATSFSDGLANTKAMADAGSELAKWALSLTIGGNNDWYLASQDELEIVYRALKPTSETNSQYGRSGINVSAVPPSYPYLIDSPAQTQAAAFQSGAEEAFELDFYWSSTQHASISYYAWGQDFDSGSQYSLDKFYEGRARAVRRLIIQ